ncbi:head completion/stabilization protein, partial [Enterobacter hormaechei]|uniref:head completion/stabilization protein n=1 Tax=Enterobacter hormaechei TaxID=158836 RepID=UPI0005E537E2
MKTLIIEPKKEPQDVPGVVIPPPGVSEPVIKNTPFFPDVDPKRVREEMRLEQTVSPVRLRRAIKTAIAETNAELSDWRERQLDAGYAPLEAVPTERLEGASVRGFHSFNPLFAQ